MKYITIGNVSKDGKYNALSKARDDIVRICKEDGCKPLNIKILRDETIKNKVNKAITRIREYTINSINVSKSFKILKKDDVLILQYPFFFYAFFTNHKLKKVRKKGVKTIAVIHDIESLRFYKESFVDKIKTKIRYKNALRQVDFIISHNVKMSEYIMETCNIKKERIRNLELFDYVLEKTPDFINRQLEKTIVVAGNLSINKAKYLGKLNEIKELTFNLYGKGYTQEVSSNINYKGAFLPDEIDGKLEGSFGLVWDGESIETCSGNTGNYLRYNNPHKMSLYLAAGLPVIVWKQSATRKFVEDNNVGICVNSLCEISKVIDNLSIEQYKELEANAQNVSRKLVKGDYFLDSLNKIEF